MALPKLSPLPPSQNRNVVKGKKSFFSPLSHQWKGGLWKTLASACFACVNGMVRYLSGGVPDLTMASLPYAEIVFLQNVIGLVFLLPFFLKGGLRTLKTSFPVYQFLYVLSAVVGLLLWYGSLRYMPLTHAVALAFTGPIFTLLGCRLFLKEKLTSLRVCAIVCSFLGAFVITRPDLALLKGEGLTAELGIYTLLPLLSAVAWVLSKLLGRVLVSRGESAQRMTVYLLGFMAPISLIPALTVWVNPSLTQWGWIFLIGGFSCVAHVTLTYSYALATVSFLMPFGFLRLVLSGAIGYVAFGEIPKTIGIWFGMIVITTSLLLLALEKKTFSAPKNLSL